MAASVSFVEVTNLGADYDVNARFDHEDGQFEFILQHESSAFSTIQQKQFKLARVVTDMEVFLIGLKPLLQTEIECAINEYRSIRYAVVAHVVYEKVTEPDRPPIIGFLRTDLVVALGIHDVLPTIWVTLGKVRARHINFIRESSGLRERSAWC